VTGWAKQPGPARAYSLLCVEATPGRQWRTLGLAGAYLLLFLLGVMEGLIGSFQFPHSPGGVPVVALGFCLLILLTCLLAGRGMGTALGAVAPAVGWLIASLVLALPTSGGSVIVTNSTAGKLYLYGGTVCASLGVGLAMRGQRRPPPGTTGTSGTTGRPSTTGTSGTTETSGTTGMPGTRGAPGTTGGAGSSPG
jgi:Family of unknown function (DUF6113)